MLPDASELLNETGAQAHAHQRFRGILLLALPAMLVAAACLLPYLNKPFTIDDPLFLQESRQILISPLHPMRTEICWNEDNWCGPLAGTAPNNLLMPYLLTAVVATGEHEWTAHGLQLLILCAGIVATVSLARRLGFDRAGAAAAGLLVAATPPVLAMASTAMPDVLAMSLGVMGVERLVAWRQEGRRQDGVLSAVWLGLAGFARIHMILLWICCLVLLPDDARIGEIRSWAVLRRRVWPIAGAAVLCGVALWITREPGAGVGPGANWISKMHVWTNARAYLLDLVLAMPLGAGWLLLRNRLLSRIAIAAGLVMLAGVLLIRELPGHHLHGSLWEVLCAAIGLLVLLDIAAWVWQRGGGWRLALLLWLLLPLAAVAYIHLPVKFLVPCAPAAALLLVDVSESSRWRLPVLAGVVAASLIFGCLVLHADNQFAEAGPAAVNRLVTPYIERGRRVWIVSQWGLQWYALKAGAKPLWTGQVPKPGDYLIRGQLEGYEETMSRLPHAVLVQTYSPDAPGGRSMSVKDGAGLYSNHFGPLMWAWGTGPYNRYELWRFTR